MELDKYIDAYDIKARVAPALIAIFPLLFSIWVWFPITETWANALSGTVFAIFFAWLLGRVARDKGLKVQERLFSKWGGNVAERMLRWDDDRISQLDKKRFHQALEKNIEGLILPTAEEEAVGGSEVEEKYRLAIGWLRRKTRDGEKFFLLLKENINYGFHRNLYGLKSLAVSSYLIIVLLNLIIVFKGEQWSLATYLVSAWSSIGVGVVAILIWVFFITEQSVKSAASAYAERLLEAIEEFN